MKKKRRRTLGEVTKKDFVAIASILCEHSAPASLAGDLARYFKAQNPRFDTDRFITATGKCRR